MLYEKINSKWSVKASIKASTVSSLSRLKKKKKDTRGIGILVSEGITLKRKINKLTFQNLCSVRHSYVDLKKKKKRQLYTPRENIL